MPQVLEELNLESDVLDAQMTEAEEAAAHASLAIPAGWAKDPDLSDGGQFGAVKLTPYVAGRPSEKGRPAARRAWSWTGAESLLPLAWNPDGTIHDGARRYLLKKACICCRKGGIKTAPGKVPVCPQCAKNNCGICRGGTDAVTVNQLKNGKSIKGWLVPNFYLRLADVPFPEHVYGTIDCFLEACQRRGAFGFKTDADMRMHATSRHRVEYRVHQDSLAASKTDEVAELRATGNALLLRLAGPQVAPVVQAPVAVVAIPQTSSERSIRAKEMWAQRKAREAREAKAEETATATIQ